MLFAMDDDTIIFLTNIQNDVKVLVGVGYANEGVDKNKPTINIAYFSVFDRLENYLIMAFSQF